MNLFATVLTYPAPSANYRGESEMNRTVIQKITDGRFEFPIISPEAMRNALREILAAYDLPCNRTRLHDEDQLAVKFEEYPNPGKYADDFFFGYLVAASNKDRQKILKEVKRDDFTFKRDSILRMNLAKGLEPYRYNTVFTQSPKSVEGSAYQNDKNSSLLHRETVATAFQYPFALNLNDCKKGPAEWTAGLLKGIAELNGVSGNHARSYYEMAPASIVIRLTDSLVAGYNTYGFQKKKGKDDQMTFPELVEGFQQDPPDYPPSEFYFGGRIVREMSEETQARLRELSVTLDRSPQRLMQTVSDKITQNIFVG
jgi:CRISPR-associated protein Cst2